MAHLTSLKYLTHRFLHKYVCQLPAAANVVVTLSPVATTDFMHDIHATQEAVRAGTTQDAQHQRLCRQWDDFCSTLLVVPIIQDSYLTQVDIL